MNLIRFSGRGGATGHRCLSRPNAVRLAGESPVNESRPLSWKLNVNGVAHKTIIWLRALLPEGRVAGY